MKRALITLALVSLLAGCGGNDAASSSSPHSVAVAVVPAPANAKAAELTIYRRSKFVGSAIHPSIQLNGQDLVTVHNGHYFHARLAPGKYTLAADGKSPSELDAKAGEKYFLLLTVVPGFVNGNGNLTWVTEPQAKADMGELGPVDPDEVENKAFR